MGAQEFFLPQGAGYPSCALKLPPCYYQSNYTKVEAILLSALPKENKRTSRLIFTQSFYAERQVKQGSCEYQLF